MNPDEKTTLIDTADEVFDNTVSDSEVSNTQNNEAQSQEKETGGSGMKTRMNLGPLVEMKGGVMIPVSFRKPYELGYITSVTETQIRYTRLFFIQMHRLAAEKGMTASQAYTELGFNIGITGKERAQQAMRKAMKKAETGELLRRNPGEYQGNLAVTDDLFQTLDQMNDTEEIAQLKAMVLYYSELAQAQKKTLTAFRDMTTH